MSIWDVLRQRGFYQQCTDEAAVTALAGQVTAYTGFDPTANSFHVGHLIPLMALSHLQKAGGRPIALLGGGTAMIGDPTGKNEMRKVLSIEELDANTQALRKQLSRGIDFASGGVLVNNADWLRGLGYIEFLREVGHHFSVNRMLTFETFKQRLEGSGLSFIEFNYPLLQSYDFLHLYRTYGCNVQLGGDDQWANIISGVDLVRRMARAPVYGWTFPLLTTAGGKKMGKTEKGALWLDAHKTSPYEYYQYWVNVDDADVAKCLGFFTYLPMEEVRALAKREGADIRQAKQKLALEATAVIHGMDEARRAEAGAQALFAVGGDLSGAPTKAYTPDQLAAGVEVSQALVDTGLAKSKGEARRKIQEGAVWLGDTKVTDHALKIEKHHFDAQGGVLLKLGKKHLHRLVVE